MSTCASNTNQSYNKDKYNKIMSKRKQLKTSLLTQVDLEERVRVVAAEPVGGVGDACWGHAAFWGAEALAWVRMEGCRMGGLCE